MRITIEHGQTRRIIEGCFNLMINQQDLHSLIEQLRAHYNRRDEDDATGGWLQIHADIQPNLSNQQPKGWDE